jgi:hypothetical protein
MRLASLRRFASLVLATEHSLLGFGDSFTMPAGANGRHDQSLSIRRDVELGILRDLQELENGLINNKPGAISDGLETLDHGPIIT